MKFFWSTFKVVEKHKVIGIITLLLIVAFSAFYASRLQFTEDITKMLPATRQLKQFSFVYSNSKFLDKLVFHITLEDSLQKPNPLLLSQFADRFSDSLERRFVPEFVNRIDRLPSGSEMQKTWDFVLANLPVFLDKEDYLRIDSMIQPDRVSQSMKNNYKMLISPVGLVAKNRISTDPLQLSMLALHKFSDFQAGDNFKLYNNHILSRDERSLLLIITPAETNNTAQNDILVEGIDALILDLKAQGFEELKVQYFGNAVVALGNAKRIKKDIILTVSLALAFLLVFISLFFRKKSSFLMVFLPVVFGGLLALAGLSVIKHEVSAISLGIGSILLGISVDYALHILSHYRKYQDVRRLLQDISTPILLSSFTTAAAFFILHFTQSKALNDLGLFAALSVLGAALFSVFVLPHFMRIKKEKEAVPEPSVILNWVDRLAGFDFYKSKIVRILMLVCTAGFLYTAQDVPFDADMMKANYMSDALQQAQDDLNKVTNLSKKSIYLVSSAKTLDKALENSEEVTVLIDSLKRAGIIQNAAVISSFYKSIQAQEEAIRRWETFWGGRKEALTEQMLQEGAAYGFKNAAFQPFFDLLGHSFVPLDEAALAPVRKLLADNYLITTDTLCAVINVVKVNNRIEDIQTVHAVFSDHPNIWVVDKQIITSDSVLMLKDIFDQLIIYSLSLVFIILLIAYGRIELTLVTMIPIVISWIWTVGLMGLFGISFNIFNIVILTFIFGLGVDYSIFIMRGLLQNYKYGTHDLSSYKVSVILSGITTLAGIGVLIFAKHPALRSIALMSIIGILSVIFITFSLLPAIFRWMVSYKEGLRNRPITLVDFLFSIMSLIIFMSGAIFMTLLAYILIPLPFNERKKKYFFHWLFSRITRILIRANVLSKEHYEQKELANYDKPAVIITNHQSHIDLMLMMLIDPRVVILTNRRNYMNPVYGKALQYADFELSDVGNEHILNSLRSKVKDGYSVLVFPEGTRSNTGKLKRFHKGAFLIARELGLEIQPIIIHGVNQLLKKSEFFLKRGHVITRFLPRIDLSKNEYGESLRDQTKGVQEYFRAEYRKVRLRAETPKFYKDYIKKNYLYKGPVLEWYTRVKLRLENNYAFFDTLIPRAATITDLGCGYGYLAYMLNMVSEERIITAVDYDEDKIAVAKHCAIKNEQVQFVAADICTYHMTPSDVFILNDVLHYLPVQEQVNTIKRCAEQLNDGGFIIIRDGSKDLEKRHRVTRFSELLSTGIGFNKAEHKLEFLSRDNYKELAGQLGLKLEVVDPKDATSNLIFLMRK